MSTKINVRSPYYEKVSASPLSYVTMDLYVWVGTNSTPADPIYTITKTEVENNDYVVFEISELVRDYLGTTFSDNYAVAQQGASMVWVQWSTSVDGDTAVFSSKYLACDGYGYFEDGINPNLSTDLLQSNTIVYYSEGENINIPAFSENVGQIKKGATVLDTISDGGGSNQKIQYYEVVSTSLSSGDQLDIYDDTNSTVLASVTIEAICEPKYTPYKATFINKFGALQDMWFFKRSDTNINVKNDSYKANILDLSSLSYSTTAHQMQRFNVNGNETITLNSGFYNEEYNEVVRQLMLSEKVWLDDGTNVIPANINTSSYRFQKSVNDKLIQHTLEFSLAYDKINNIR